jgi:hypothetical protein
VYQKTSQYLVTTSLMQHNISFTELIKWFVACGMLSHFNGCAKLLDIGGNWSMQPYTLIQSIQTCSMGDMSGEYAGHGRTGTFSFQEVYRPLRHGAVQYHEVMAVGLRISPCICIQVAINKTKLRSFSVAYACSYHNPTATMERTVHNIDTSKPNQTRTPN